MKTIGVLTSGGDAPGMNAAIRSVCRTALFHNIDCYGIHRGYQGLIDGEIAKLTTTDVSNIIQRGGTILKTARSEDFRSVEGRVQAAENLRKHQIDGLVIIGGDGSFKGAQKLFEEHQINVIGIPGTIDNDITGTESTIGFDTALNTAVNAIDKIRDTAEAHNRIFLVEVMGRDAGYLALHSGISCGAEHVFIPEQEEDLALFLQSITDDRKRKKLTNLIIVAEGDEFGGAEKINDYLAEKAPYLKTRVTVLGHIQRGGSPTPNDRILASRMGYDAVKALLNKESGKMIGLQQGQIVRVAFPNGENKHRAIAKDLTEIASILAK